MNKIKLIKTESEYQTALTKIERLLAARRTSEETDELELLSALVEFYEDRHHPVLPPDPIDAIKFRMDQMGLKAKDLVPIMGSRAKVSEILSGKRPLTLSLIRTLHDKFKIPAAILLQEPAVTSNDITHPEKLPWHDIVERKWLWPAFRGTVEDARRNYAELARHLFRNLKSYDIQPAFFRRNLRAAKFDPHTLLAWTARIVNVATDTLCVVKYRRNSVDEDFARKLLSLSVLSQGPQLAKEFLLRNGIVLVIERHLQQSHVDGAAIMLESGTPAIGLSLRYDRLDNFWFCLFHELAHVALHLDKDEEKWFVDDLDLADSSGPEKMADEWAQKYLIPPKYWERVQECTTGADVVSVARELHVSPAIVAGRLRYERKNYKLFSNLIGQREVRHQLLPEAQR